MDRGDSKVLSQAKEPKVVSISQFVFRNQSSNHRAEVNRYIESTQTLAALQIVRQTGRILSELLDLSDALAAVVSSDPSDLKTGRALIQTAQQIHRLSAAYGLNPQDRARLKLPSDQEPDDFEKWMQGYSSCWASSSKVLPQSAI